MQLLLEVSRGLRRLILVVGNVDHEIDTSEYPNLVIIDAGFKRRQRPLNIWKVNRLVSKLIKSESVDVVHDTYANLVPLMFSKSRYPGVVFLTSLFANEGWRLKHVWGNVPLFRKLSSLNTAIMYVNRLFEWTVIRRSDFVIVQAPGLIERVTKFNNVSTSKIRVVTNNIDADEWSPHPDKPTPDHSDSEDLRLLFVGGIGRTRGVPTMIDAVGLLAKRGIGSTLTLVGSPEPNAFEELNDQAKSLRISDRIIFAGRISREQVRSAFSNYEMFLYLTINDGSPRIVLEAVSTGIPVIATRHPGIEVIDPEGDVISYAEPDDAEAVAGFVTEFINDRPAWEEKVVTGRQIAKDRFGSEHVARQYVDLYQELVDNPVR